MNVRHLVTLDSLSGTPFAAPSPSNYMTREDEPVIASSQTRLAHDPSPASFLVRMAMRVSRSRWFNFLRRVFQYQNGSRLDLGSDPFNSTSWMMLEFIALVVQISITATTLSLSKTEKPVWPMRMWIIAYDFGCSISLLVLYWRFRHCHFRRGDIEQQTSNENSRSLHLVNRCRTSLELFYAMWFVMGNVWLFDARLRSFQQAPKLHVLCIVLLAWNAVSYSFPFFLFVLLCICVPLVSSLIGYNMSMSSTEKGASNDQIAELPCWRYKQVESNFEIGNSEPLNDYPECCICLAKYKDKEVIRQLPCLHIFHQKCVDQWLRIISCCPLCKQGLHN
ncbi:hypothetical protein Ancab_003960 [Ancistrocladus abbreviatus]